MQDGAIVDGNIVRDLYSVWFRTGWRSIEICALRLDWLDWPRQAAHLNPGWVAEVCGTLEEPSSRSRSRQAGAQAGRLESAARPSGWSSTTTADGCLARWTSIAPPRSPRRRFSGRLPRRRGILVAGRAAVALHADGW